MLNSETQFESFQREILEHYMEYNQLTKNKKLPSGGTVSVGLGIIFSLLSTYYTYSPGISQHGYEVNVLS